ncbi:autotransporter domain-containing protein [Candidatus Berkiella aquae]|uniref:Autotransporter domain-containing protein n=1 Tax=Candidatus Berkiella aquae TaxID=295108 RepID=A0AAE3HWD6_9GAMM|nr:autotransporter domain-containing protein [Candidatus Berkiella aquae]MCS5711295.1 autotransporter domain-containing protein [Candidatus Berkiella aquae]
MHVIREKKIHLSSMVIASTLFGFFSSAAYSFTSLDLLANLSNSNFYPPTTGYNYISPLVTFDVVDGDNVGTTNGISIDNNFGNNALLCLGTGCIGTVFNFDGTTTVAGTVGATNPIGTINLLGASKTVTFQGDINVNTSLNFGVGSNASTTITLANGVDVDGDITTAVANTGTLQLLGNNIITEGVGTALLPLNAINLSGGAGTVVEFKGVNNEPIVAKTMNFLGNATVQIDAAVPNLTANIETNLNNQGTLTYVGGSALSVLNGTIGASSGNSLANLNLNTGNAAIANTFEVTGATFKVANINLFDNAGAVQTTLILNNPNLALTSQITPQTNNTDILDVNNATSITGGIGTATNAFAEVKVGAINPLIINGNIYATNTNFYGDQTLTLQNANTLISGNIGNATGLAGKGTLLFQGSGEVTGTIGANQSLNSVNLSGPAANVIFDGNVTAVNGLNFVAGATANTTASLANNVTLTGNIDANAANIGTLQFLGNATVTGTVGAANTLHQINLSGATGQQVNFQNDIDTTLLVFQNNATASLAAGKTLTGNVDSTMANSGVLQFVGAGTVTGSIGATNPLNLITLNSGGGANTIELDGATIQASTINIEGAGGTTLLLNDVLAPMQLTANITTNNNGIDTLNVLNPGGNTTITGNIGSATNLFNLVKIGANTDTTVAGDIFANNVQFQGDHLLTINGNIDSAITTLNNNTGSLIIASSSTINSPIGGVGFLLKNVTIQGGLGTTVDLSDNLFVTDTIVKSGSNLLSSDNVAVNGNLTIQDANSALSVANSTNLTVNGNFNLGAGTFYNLDMGGNNLTTGLLTVNGIATISPNAKITIANPSVTDITQTHTIPIITAGLGSNLSVLPVINASLFFDITSQVTGPGNTILQLVLTPKANAGMLSNLPGGTIGSILINIGLSNQATGELQAIIEQLSSYTTLASLNAALAQLAPTVDGGTVQASFDAQSLALNEFSDQIDYSTRRRGYAAGDWNQYSGAWIKLYGQEADQSERDSVAGYHDEMVGVALGGDVLITDDALAGLGLSFSTAKVKHDVSAGTNTQINSYQATVYGRYEFFNPLYLDWFGAITYNTYQQQRNVSIGSFFMSPSSNYDGWQTGLKGELGYVFDQDCWHIIPIFSLYYSHLSLDSYTETGGGTANQNVNEQSYDLFQAGIGIRVAYDYLTPQITWQPEVHARIFYDFVGDTVATTSQFIGAGPSFVTEGAKPAQTSYNLGLKLTAFEHENLTLTASYDFLFKEDFTSNTAYLKFRYDWDHCVRIVDVLAPLKMHSQRPEIMEERVVRTLPPSSDAYSGDYDDSVWQVQVGAFSNPENARVMVDKLRLAGYAVYTELKKHSGRTLVVVLVDDLHSRNEAENVKQLLHKQFNVKGQIVH